MSGFGSPLDVVLNDGAGKLESKDEWKNKNEVLPPVELATIKYSQGELSIGRFDPTIRLFCALIRFDHRDITPAKIRFWYLFAFGGHSS